MVRLAQLSDCDRLVDLCQQLGYLVAPEQLQQRLQELQQASAEHVVYVAETSAATRAHRVIGWIHLYIQSGLLSERSGIIGGLVVDATFRQQGIGALLLQQAEQWARQHGCREMVVRSNVVRQAAHRFYERNGFVEVKRSVVLHKPLLP